MLTLIPIGLPMAKDDLSGKLAVILHADVAGSTQLVQQTVTGAAVVLVQRDGHETGPTANGG